MLRITPSVSAAAAKSYFRDALSKGDYYLPGTPGLHRVTGQEIIGRWWGIGAERLGLDGKVTKAAFERLCDNLHPVTKDKLTPRTKDDRRVAYDLTFSVPKSVSIVAELCGDAGTWESIAVAFREAVAETLAEMEAAMKTRVRRKGENSDRVTGNMAVAEFVHFTSRPVDGVPDMHLHLHAFAFNCTWDAVEKRWKAGEFGDLKRDAPYHQAACDARLAAKLAALGYPVERRSVSSGAGGGGWEIAGVPESLVRKFSRRTDEIERLAKELGVTDPDRKSDLGMKSRVRKKKSMTMEALREEWRSRLSGDEQAALRAVSERARAGSVRTTAATLESHAERSVAFALAHSLERASVVSEKRLLAAALEHGIGRTTLEAVGKRLETLVTDKQVLRATLDGEVMLTTPETLAEEQAMLATVREGRGRHLPLKLHHQFIDPELSAEQREAVRHVLESTDSVVLLRGRAGVGKTRVLQEVVKALESSGYRVQVAAPTGMATHEVLRKEGFTNAVTSAKVLSDRNIQEQLRGHALWVDEAGLLSMPDLAKLIALASEKNCRLLLTGDTAQHRSVARGDALRLLETESGLKSATLTEVRRQKEEKYREAVVTMAKGDLVKGFAQLDAMGAIREAWDKDRPRIVAETYMEALRRGDTTLVVAPTHAEGRQATEVIRDALKKDGRLSSEETTFERLHNRQLTAAQRSDPSHHRVGDVVQFHHNAPGLPNGPGVRGRSGCFRPGDKAKVVGVTEKEVILHRLRDDQLVRLPLQAPNAFQVFERREVNFAAGDRLRITYTGRDAGGLHRLSNGAIYTIKDIDHEGVIRLENGWKVPRTFGHLTYGYAVTSDSSQGRNIDHIIDLQSWISEAASNMQQLYTTITRGRQRVTIATDDKDRLLLAVARDNSRMTATEFMKLAREQLLPPGAKERGLEHREKIGRWTARENTRRLKEEANRYIRQEERRRERTKSRSRSDRDDRRRDGNDRGVSRER